MGGLDYVAVAVYIEEVYINRDMLRSRQNISYRLILAMARLCISPIILGAT